MTEQVSERYPNKALWLCWTLATALGVTVGSAAFNTIQGRDWAVLLLAGLVGLAIGSAQALVLWLATRSVAQWLRVAIPWLLVNIVSWIVGIVVALVGVFIVTMLLYFANVGDYALVYQVGASPLPMVLAGLVGGVSVGLLEQWVFDSRSIPVSQWTRISTIGWLAAGFVGWGVGNLVPGSENFKWMVGGAAAGLIAGVITGEALARLTPIRSPRGTQSHE